MAPESWLQHCEISLDRFRSESESPTQGHHFRSARCSGHCIEFGRDQRLDRKRPSRLSERQIFNCDEQSSRINPTTLPEFTEFADLLVVRSTGHTRPIIVRISY